MNYLARSVPLFKTGGVGRRTPTTHIDFGADNASQFTAAQDAGSNYTWSWDTVNKRLVCIAWGQQGTYTLNNPSLTDVVLEVETSQASDAGIVWRFQDQQNYYLLTFSDDTYTPSGANYNLYRRVAGVFTLITAGVDTGWVRGTTYSIRVEMLGSTICVYRDGTLLITATDTNITAAGKVGLRSNGASGAQSYFNSMSVRKADALFTRSTPAYLDGTEYASGVPRFPSQSGIVGVLVEEGTTNKITSTPGSGTLFNPGDTTGWTKGGADTVTSVFSVVTDDAATAALGFPAGTKVYKLDNSAGTAPAIATSTGAVGNLNKHSLSVFARGSGGFRLFEHFTSSTSFALRTLTAGYTQYKLENHTPGNVAGCFAIRAEIGAIVYFCLPQMEEKAYCTTPTIGTRNAETLTIPTAGLLVPSQGSVILKVYVSGNLIVPGVGGNGHTFFYHRTPDGNNTIQFDKQTTGYRLALRNANNTSTTITTANVTLAQGWYIFGGRWSATEASIWWEGVKRANTVNPANPGVLDPSAYIGVNNAGTAQLNQPIAWMALYNKALTDAEMAAATTGNLPPDFTAYANFTGGTLSLRGPGGNTIFDPDLFTTPNTVVFS